MDFVKTIENALGKKAKIKFLPMQAGDVVATWADINDLIDDVGFKPATNIKVGVEKLIRWYLDYHNFK